MKQRRMRTLCSPIGVLRLVASPDALMAVYLPDQPNTPALEGAVHADSHQVLNFAASELEEYFAGRLRTFSTPRSPSGTPFQRQVWGHLERIAFGDCASYGQLAQRLGKPSAARAVGSANGKNPISILVPCHRVIAANGQLGGYAGGLTAKRWLLDHEARVSHHPASRVQG